MKGNLGARIAYGVSLAVSFAFVFFFGGIVPYTVFYLMVAIPLFSLIQLVLAASFLRYEQKSEPEIIVRGEDARLVLELHNRMFILPITHIELTILASQGLDREQLRTHTAALLPRERKSVGLPIRFRYRGIYQAGLERIRLYDMFNLFRFDVSVSHPLEIIVYPVLIPLSRLSLPGGNVELAGRQRMRGVEEIFDIADTRSYQYGDTLSRIHWNLTARNQQLTTKLYDHEQDEQVLVILDTVRACGDPEIYLALEDCAVSTCLAVTYFLLGKGISVTLRFFSGEKLIEASVKAGGRTDAVFAALSAADFVSSKEPYTLMGDIGKQSRRIFIFSTAMTDESAGRINNIVPKDCSLIVYRVKPVSSGRQEEIPDGNQRVLTPSDNLKLKLEQG